MPAEHFQRETLKVIHHYPAHEPRADDPNYKLFNQARARLKRQGLLKCVIGNEDCAGGIQLHHAHVEFAFANAVDIDRLNKAFGLDLDDKAYQTWIESPGNLEPLCERHHLGIVGVHFIPSADWDMVRVHKQGFAPVQLDRGEA